MQGKSEVEFTIGIWPLKVTVKGREAIRAMRLSLSVLVVALAFAILAMAFKHLSLENAARISEMRDRGFTEAHEQLPDLRRPHTAG